TTERHLSAGAGTGLYRYDELVWRLHSAIAAGGTSEPGGNSPKRIGSGAASQSNVSKRPGPHLLPDGFPSIRECSFAHGGTKCIKGSLGSGRECLSGVRTA